jgi:superfamily II DNA helicase RecQ
VPAFVVFSDRTLKDISAARPLTSEELLSINGIGPVKADRYGEEILEVLKGQSL